MHGQCDVRPTVTLLPQTVQMITGHWPVYGRYQIILLGEQRHMCVNNLRRVQT